MTRRKFLISAGGLTLVAIGAYPFVKNWFLSSASTKLPLPADPVIPWNGRTQSFEFSIKHGRVQLANGQSFDGYLINNQFPGPEIHVQEGDRVKIMVVNNLEDPASLHWHGVNTPSDMDGVPGVSRDPILPGQTFTYEFIASPAGTRWYHSHVYEMNQVPNGLFGPLIIEPASKSDSDKTGTGNNATHSLKDHVLLLSAWGYQETPPTGPSHGMMRGGMMDGGMQSSSQGLTYLVNGQLASSLQPISLNAGEKIRLRIINASATESFLLQADGANLTVTHTDGNPLPAPKTVQHLYISSAERYDVEITPGRTGTWYLRSLLEGQETVQIPFVTQGQVTAPAGSTAPAWSYEELSGISSGESLPPADQTFRLVLSGGMMMSDRWTINGKSYPDTTPIRIKKGQRIRLEMFNMSMMEHPMHLHGHSFAVTSFNGKTLASPLIKDVVNLRHMERCTIDFIANNPGNWFFHCHNLEHMVGGLATVVEYDGVPAPGLNKWM